MDGETYDGFQDWVYAQFRDDEICSWGPGRAEVVIKGPVVLTRSFSLATQAPCLAAGDAIRLLVVEQARQSLRGQLAGDAGRQSVIDAVLSALKPSTDAMDGRLQAVQGQATANLNAIANLKEEITTQLSAVRAPELTSPLVPVDASRLGRRSSAA